MGVFRENFGKVLGSLLGKLRDKNANLRDVPKFVCSFGIVPKAPFRDSFGVKLGCSQNTPIWGVGLGHYWDSPKSNVLG